MRHGYEWWEAFWKWLLENLPDDPVYDINMELKTLPERLKWMKTRFEKLWSSGVVIPPTRRQET